MKSAFELAMERLQASDPGHVEANALTDADRALLQQIEQKCKAKIAERDIFLQKRLQEARRERDAAAVEQIETQMRSERLRFTEEMDLEKEKVRAAARARSATGTSG